MSSFVLERRYALQMPGSYVDVDAHEMEYLEGSADFREYWWGWACNLYDSGDEVATMADLIDFNLIAAGTVAGLGAWISGYFPLIGGSMVIASAIYALNCGYVKTKLKGAANTHQNATLSKNFVGYSVSLW